MDRYVAFRSPSDMHAALLAEAHARGVSVSRVIRDLIAKGIGRDATPAEGRRAA
jgi:hypothetical protein